jgi:serine/threonine protein kinase
MEEVAVKALERTHPEYQEYLLFLQNEAKFAAVFQHPSIVRVLGLEEDERGVRLSMELMKGGSLHDLITSGNRIDEVNLLKIGLQVANALAIAYEKSVIHRDIKPANILFTASQEAKLADFGLAQSIIPDEREQSHLALERHIMATPDYVSPEILNGEQGDFQSDIYALGGTLFHAFIGKAPFSTDGLSTEELIVIKRSSPMITSSTTQLHPSTVALINQMLSPDKARRFASYKDLIIAFRVTLNHLERKTLIPAPAAKQSGRLTGIFQQGKK